MKISALPFPRIAPFLLQSAEPAPSIVRDTVTLGGPPPAAAAGDDVEVQWGLRGHALVNREASRDLPPDMPAFFREAGDQLEALASEPDRWKLKGLPSLDVINRPDHHLDLELIADRTLPPERYGFVNMVAANHLQKEGDQPYRVGFLPYAIAENMEKLTAELALWRHESARSGESSVMARQHAQNALYVAGILGHYAGDASQPMHLTVHHDGWDSSVEPNPGGFTEKRGLHYRFESLFVNAGVKPAAVAARLQPARVLEGAALDIADRFCRASHDQVRTVYTLDRDGRLDPANPSAEGLDFATGCVANGAQLLRDLWYTAWVRSEALAGQVQDPTRA